MAEEKAEDIERYDDRERWRCPMLGGPVTFGYCRRFNEGLFCARLLECWIRQLPLVEFLKAHYSPEEIQTALAAQNKGRLARMMDAVEEAKKANPPSAD